MVKKEVNYHLIHWYHAFFRNRVQIVKVNQTYSTPIVTNIGAPQGCVRSPFIFILYTDDCRADGPNTFILKFSDDTVLLSLLGTEDNPGIHQAHTDRLVEWCEKNSLIINAKKTKEVIFGLPENSYPPPVIINNANIEQVFSYKYLGIYVDAALSWSAHIDYICGKIQQRIYFLRRLRSFGTSKPILLLFFQSIVLSVMQYGGSVWYSCLSGNLKLDGETDKYLLKDCR